MLYYAIGDVHGMSDTLEILLEAIRRDKVEGEKRLIFVGDYIDRGPNSKRVIELVKAALEEFPMSTALMGNHEDMMIYAADNRRSDSINHWMSNGGEATLASYPKRAFRSELDHPEFKADVEWMKTLPLKKVIDTLDGQFVFVHAGIKARQPLDEQSETTLLWIRGEFLEHEGPWLKGQNIRVVHGHTPALPVVVKDNRIGIDSGACFKGGFLTAARLDSDLPLRQEPKLLTVQGVKS